MGAKGKNRCRRFFKATPYIGQKGMLKFVVTLILGMVFTTPLWAQMGSAPLDKKNKKSAVQRQGPANVGGSFDRDAYVKSFGLPDGYRDLSAPPRFSGADLEDGGALYQKLCQDCHGDSGKGDGPQSDYLFRAPTNLPRLLAAEVGDGYLIWSIEEGGGQFGGLMPAFSRTSFDRQYRLERAQVWQLVQYIRQTFSPKPE
ncbi:MAG: hypothetical protein A2527_07845 [Candidatus Lambdaproteobacteria bacterium RIFOXYD2_FULL_50_16]|uniref:Cytochrome c domain-containing protein n=1 Tax=Candidatus Lambdaproteobacteria bacterium RIFOXYD2_FULL_50_16 TaxID=1817772 RepID=A0A1F6GAD8_9PROT|nr:MAG: hypothetical protein A2527_07845 [Candidatus Lambdaproteobacteria bacterium RIFOXYD2_FULL_50_16]